jgi:hypothetical protein
LVMGSSDMILLSVGISTSSNSLRPIEIIVCILFDLRSVFNDMGRDSNK